MDYYSQPPEAPVKKDRTLLNVLLAGCGCLVVIGIVAGLFFGRFFSFANQPKKTIQNQIDAINEDNYRLAYSYFSTGYQRSVSLPAFREKLREFVPFLPIKEVNLNSVNIRNNRASIEGTLGGSNGVIFPIHYELIREKEEWRVIVFEWTQPGDLLAV